MNILRFLFDFSSVNTQFQIHKINMHKNGLVGVNSFRLCLLGVATRSHFALVEVLARVYRYELLEVQWIPLSDCDIYMRLSQRIPWQRNWVIFESSSAALSHFDISLAMISTCNALVLFLSFSVSLSHMLIRFFFASVSYKNYVRGFFASISWSHLFFFAKVNMLLKAQKIDYIWQCFIKRCYSCLTWTSLHIQHHQQQHFTIHVKRKERSEKKDWLFYKCASRQSRILPFL